MSTDEYREKRNELTMDFGNTRKRKILEATARRKIEDSSLSVLNDSLITDADATMESSANNTAFGLDESTKDISLLQTVSLGEFTLITRF
jgi:hypothetical protein